MAAPLEQLIENRRLGRDPGLLTLRDSDDNRLLCAHLMAQVNRELALLSRDLDRPVYDQAPFLASLRQMALNSRFSRVRIVLQDYARVVRQGHRLVELARRLTSRIEIRVPPPDWLEYPENFLLADRHGYVHRRLSTHYAAVADYSDGLRTRHLLNLFDEVWELSEPASELRRLYL